MHHQQKSSVKSTRKASARQARHAPTARRTTRSAAPVHTSKRFLNLHEYQSKQILREGGVVVPDGNAVHNGTEAKALVSQLGGEKFVIKAQILAGGRGKGHLAETPDVRGVSFASTADQAAAEVDALMGKHLITKQTSAQGQQINAVLVEKASKIVAEKYLALLMDRQTQGPMLLVSPQGGMNIEEVAAKTPEALKKIPINVVKGLTLEQAGEAVDFLGDSTPATRDNNVQQLLKLYEVFEKQDCTQLEINPLAVVEGGDYVCVDAKLNFDDNAEFRHKNLFALRDIAAQDPREVQAAKYNLNYVGLDGNIGCMVNGAGLAMATMDIIKLHGGWPANFLDVGGGADADQVEQAFRILTRDPKVKTILVNIFGGIMKCDVIAQGIISAAKSVQLEVPLVVRLQGTNVEAAKELLEKSGLNIIKASNLEEAAIKAVAATQQKI